MPRLILVVPPWDTLLRSYESWDFGAVETQLKAQIRQGLERENLLLPHATAFRVVALPSNVPPPEGIDIDRDALRSRLVCSLQMTGEGEAARVAAEQLRQSLVPAFGRGASIGVDLVVDASDESRSHWCPSESPDGLFGDRAAALRAMHAAPDSMPVLGLPGMEAVHLVMVDTGLPVAMLPPAGLKGWPVLEDPAHPQGPLRQPGMPIIGHGAMVARNARAIAPGVRLLDCPAIPDGITQLPVFLASVVAAFHQICGTIAEWQKKEEARLLPRTSWVICNAWGVFDPEPELPGLGYADNPDHPVAAVLRDLAALSADIVFAAGNCGPFCPNSRCNPAYTGPGRSINGANASPEVLTVGAVRTDGIWLGYSGPGPGIAGLAHDKPDLSAPSQFEDGEGFTPNTGTSAACGLAAGAVAQLRTRWPSAVVDPTMLKETLWHTAGQPEGPAGWQERTGYGVLNLAKAADAMPDL
ncbi:S8 family serine peptidase [Roseomonas sp. HJA6]|uniref:S8 family serine peptidase n=1 Tax=Roseomonas alba TaxID=2846776 RepID=A0ABS7AA23_9PROT|nr:S8 family serine peptidase [Neoroseomonas alba]MBW6399145.1 S8 family serine peptidase [Neoroseomonas alba]